MSFSNDLFWENVSGDHEKLAKTASLVHAKVAAATWWPFLSHAASETDFENRLSLVSAKIEAAVGPDTYEEVVSSLRDDYRAVYEASYADTHKDAGPPGRKMRLKDYSEDEIKQAHLDAAKDEDDERRAMEKEAAEKNPYVTGERTQCRSCNGWGSYGGDGPKSKDSKKCEDCDGKGYREHKKTATNYQPDPNAAWRYHQPYQNIEGAGQLNNGALQDSDGFPVDLAQGEYDAANQRMQFQLTPGQWTEHDGMPERPMPQGVARGYQPVAAQRESAYVVGPPVVPGGNHKVYEDGREIAGMESNRRAHDVARESSDMDYAHIMGMEHAQQGVSANPFSPGSVTHLQYGRGNEGYDRTGYHSSDPLYGQYDEAHRHGSLRVDADGFLVESKEGGEHAPYRIKEEGGRYYVENDKGERKEEKGYSSKNQAREHQKALYANVPGAAESAERDSKKKSSLQVDSDGFLVEASDVAQEGVRGRAVEPLRDPVPGATQRVNPYYFNDGAAMGANEGFPVQPSEDPQDRVNEIYGETAPAASVQDTSSSADGNGYSRSHPGESPDFSQGAGERTSGRHSAPNDGYAYTGEGYPASDEVHDVLNYYRVHPTIHDPHALVHGLLGMEPRNRHSQEYMDAYNRGADNTRTSAWHPDPEEVPSPGDLAEDHADFQRKLKNVDLNDGSPWSARPQHGNWTDDDPWNERKASQRVAYDEHDRAAAADDARLDNHMEYQHLSGEHGFEPHPDCWVCQQGHGSPRHASTDGKIVDHCPGCSQPRRSHDTAHGPEIRHLHNDHVRCHGDKTAKKKTARDFGRGVSDAWNANQQVGRSGEQSKPVWKDYPITCNYPGCGQTHWSGTPTSEAFNQHVQEHVNDYGWDHGDVEHYTAPHPMDHQSAKKTAAVPYPNSTIHHPVNEGDPYHVTCPACGPVVSHPDYNIAHAMATDHSTQHWVAAHDDKFGQGAHAREFPWLYEGALANGGNIDGHERPLTFAEGLEYNGGYGVHTAEGQLSSGSVHTADYLGRPDAQNPTGKGTDEYEARNWDAYSRQRPMQTPEDRNVNTPVLGKPLPTRNVNTPTPGLKDGPVGRDGEDEEEE